MSDKFDMTPEEAQAYDWARQQEFQSVAARHARALAEYAARVSVAEVALKTQNAELLEHLKSVMAHPNCSVRHQEAIAAIAKAEAAEGEKP